MVGIPVLITGGKLYIFEKGHNQQQDFICLPVVKGDKQVIKAIFKMVAQSISATVWKAKYLLLNCYKIRLTV